MDAQALPALGSPIRHDIGAASPRTRRAGAIAIAATGVLIPVSTLLRGPFVNPRDAPVAFAAWVTSPAYLAASLLFIVGLLAQIAAVIALFQLLARGRSPRLAFGGTLLTILTDALMLLAMGVFCFSLPAVGRMYRGGHGDVMAMATELGSTFIAFQAVQALTLTTGTILTAIAIARTPELPRWTAWTYAASGLVIAFCPPLPFATEIPATMMYGITYVLLARSRWRASH